MLGITVERSEVVDTLSGLVEEGMAKAYLLSRREPYQTEIARMPPIDLIEMDFQTYFYITKKGLDFHCADGTWWPFTDDDTALFSIEYFARPNDSVHLFLAPTLDLDHLHAAGCALHNDHVAARHTSKFRKETNTLVVRLAIDRWCCEIKLIGLTEPARDGGPLGPRMRLHRDTRHSTFALRFATPAATRVSTTSNAIASSSQSWLEPSAFCVATVSV